MSGNPCIASILAPQTPGNTSPFLWWRRQLEKRGLKKSTGSHPGFLHVPFSATFLSFFSLKFYVNFCVLSFFFLLMWSILLISFIVCRPLYFFYSFKAFSSPFSFTTFSLDVCCSSQLPFIIPSLLLSPLAFIRPFFTDLHSSLLPPFCLDRADSLPCSQSFNCSQLVLNATCLFSFLHFFNWIQDTGSHDLQPLALEQCHPTLLLR